jgi:hypothetical protein
MAVAKAASVQPILECLGEKINIVGDTIQQHLQVQVKKVKGIA